jgi:hypothetical protein
MVAAALRHLVPLLSYNLPSDGIEDAVRLALKAALEEA